MTRWQALRRIPALLKESAPGWTVAAIVLMVLEIVLGLASLYLIKELVDSITAGVTQGSAGYSGVLSVVVVTGVVAVLLAAARSLAAYAREAQGLRVGDYVDQLIHERATEADLAFYESPRYYDTLQRARQAGLQRPANVVANLLSLSKNVIMLAAAVALIASVNVLIVPVLALAILPALAVRLYFSRVQYEWQHRRTQLERRAGYLDWLMTADTHAKELRLNDLGPHLRHQYGDVRKRIHSEKLALTKRRSLFETLVATCAAVGFFGALAYLAREAALGRSSVGDVVMFFVVFQRAQGIGQELVGEVARLYEDGLYIQLLYSFIDVRPLITASSRPATPPTRVNKGIRLENVSFQYPGSNVWALRGITLDINPGQVVAIVGANGSGKTSLIKVLCRLYDPTEGRVTVDGRDIRDFDPDAYRNLFSVIFQDYSRYADTARENIRFGAIALAPDSPRIERAARSAGADSFVRRLTHGYDTKLTRLFDDGQELSIGQWQKLALARAFIRPSELVILDEPTSALDPQAEYELFEDFRARIDGRMALIISHRLSTVRLADIIYVMDGGTILEVGSHDALMKQRGRYWDLFSKQGKYFQDSAIGTLA